MSSRIKPFCIMRSPCLSSGVSSTLNLKTIFSNKVRLYSYLSVQTIFLHRRVRGVFCHFPSELIRNPLPMVHLVTEIKKILIDFCNYSSPH